MRAQWLICLLVPALAWADSGGGISWKVPQSWRKDPSGSSMRVATYKFSDKKKSAEGECAVFYFGQGQGGNVDDNLKRWYNQFEQPDGKPSEQVAQVKKETQGGMPVTTVDLTGTYSASMGPMAAGPKKPGYRMLGAIVEGPSGSVFFKCTGPDSLMVEAKPDFKALVGSLSK
jgi:hypothetical protein